MIELCTDGACSPNPGPGGWAAIIIGDGETRELYGFVPDTTNNRMEMLAAKAPVKNRDLWMQLDDLVLKRFVQWKWVRGPFWTCSQ